MALLSKTDVANLALTHLGKSNISNIDSDTRPEGKAVRQFWDPARREVLEKYDWSFARKRLTLSTADDSPPANWTYAYALPADMLAPRYLVGPEGYIGPKIPYEMDTSSDGLSYVLYTQLNDAILRYTFDQTNVHMFTPTFVMAFSHRLAGYVAYALTKKKTLRDDQFATSDKLIPEARAVDQNTRQARMEPLDASWVRMREYD